MQDNEYLQEVDRVMTIISLGQQMAEHAKEDEAELIHVWKWLNLYMKRKQQELIQCAE